MTQLLFTVHLSSLLNAQDIDAIASYLEIKSKMGIHILDRLFAIRKSNGLVSFSRIDIYVSVGGMIFLSHATKEGDCSCVVQDMVSIELNTE